MTTSFALKIFFEIGLVMLIFYGYKNEDKLIEFETELFAVLKFAFRKYVLKSTGKKNVRTANTASHKEAQAQRPVATALSAVYEGTGTPATRRVRAEIKAFPVENKNRNVA